jgi:hypothetical protein
MIDPGSEVTRFGFTWNYIDVERIASNRSGSYLFIGTKREAIEVRITPGGRISVTPSARQMIITKEVL